MKHLKYVVAGVALLAGMATAAQAGTLDDVKARGKLLCGVTTGIAGFGAPNDKGVHPPFDSAALIAGLDDETAALARALYAMDGPSSRDLQQSDVDYEIERLLLDLEEDQLSQRTEFTQEALGEAEREADRPAIDRLLLELRQLNETRRSLDRRRDQTRYFARQLART